LAFEGWKEIPDFAEYFLPFKAQIGPKMKKMASDYFSATLLTAKQKGSSVSKTGVPLPVFTNWCGANLKQDFFFSVGHCNINSMLASQHR